MNIRTGVAIAIAFVSSGLAFGQTPRERLGTKKPAAKVYTPPKTVWGDPQIAGVYTNNDESLIPFERPAQFEGRRLEDITEAELEKLRDDRSEQRIDADRNRAEFRSPIHWFENMFPNNSRAWLVTDPPDGHVPPADRRSAAAERGARGRQAGKGPADSAADRSLYDRCITRGLPGSMMPAIYGNAYEILQGPGYVSILYEMVHEARVIPLDGRPHPGQNIRMYMGDARGRWEGNTLVVETTNFTDKTPYRGSSEHLKMTERFKPVGAGDGGVVHHVRRSAHVGAAVDVRDEPHEEGRQPAAVRVRVQRGQLRDGGHPQRCSRRREGRQGRGQPERRRRRALI